MKNQLLLLLLLTPQFLTKPTVIDLENQGRKNELSNFINKLDWIPKKKVGHIIATDSQEAIAETNKPIKLGLTVTPGSRLSLSTDTPNLEITNGQHQVDFSLESKLSEECLLYNYRDRKKDSNISCTYTNARYTIDSKSFAKKDYKKELSIGKYVIGLTYEGNFEVGVLQDNQVIYGDEAEGLKEKFNYFEGIFIKNFYIGEEGVKDIGFLSILTENELIITEYRNVAEMIEFEKKEAFDFKAMGMDLADLNKIIYNRKELFFVLKNAFYRLVKTEEGWDKHFFDKITIDGNIVELSDFNIAVGRFKICILVKNYGLAFAQFYYDEIKVLNFLEHKYATSLITTKQTQGHFNIGVLADNQKDKNVQEFFFELTTESNADNSQEIFLSRVFISSERVRAVQADVHGLLAMFLMGSNVYIIPRNYHGLKSLPVYVYKNAKDSLGIGFVNINNNILFRLTKGDKEEDEVVSFYNKPEDNESFSCSFGEKGYYVVQVARQYLIQADHLGTKNSIFAMTINPSEGPKDDDKDKDDKDKEGKDKDDKDKDGKDKDEKDKKNEKGGIDYNETESDNTVLIIIIVVVCIIVVIGIIAVLFYVKQVRKRNSIASLLETGNYRFLA
jgi:hypothetical protein